eukprot:8136920-Alexandrium_andersonii.AAC.1
MSETGHRRLQRWIQELRAAGETLPPDCPSWHKDCIEQAIKAAGSSAPGVDGIPYEAYKRVKAAVHILQEVAQA